MKSVQITELRRTLRRAIQEVSEKREPLAICRRDQTLAVIAPPPRGGHLKPDLPLSALDDFVARHGLVSLYLFGSILTGRFHEGSDVDVMIDTGVRMPSYFQTCRMSDELEALFGRPVDLLIKSTVERDRNPSRRSSILAGARLIVEREEKVFS
jgi:predicted nucleotidyltransferase